MNNITKIIHHATKRHGRWVIIHYLGQPEQLEQSDPHDRARIAEIEALVRRWPCEQQWDMSIYRPPEKVKGLLE